jgi:hypothetical protein
MVSAALINDKICFLGMAKKKCLQGRVGYLFQSQISGVRVIGRLDMN